MSTVDPRKLVRINPERVANVSSTEYPGHWPGEDHAWDAAEFRRNLRVEIKRRTPSTIDFDVVGVDASIANAFRRILISEVETVAIEHVFVFQNTSVMHDEVLAHRLGLVPLRVNPTMLETWNPAEGATDRNTLSFMLKVACTRNPHAARGDTDPEKLYINSSVYARDLVWNPQGNQAELSDWILDPPRVAAPDILLLKMRPGQEINIEVHCVKSCGRDHAKWSPVSTATYRLLPHIVLRHPIPPHLHSTLISSFPPGVLGLRQNPETGEQEPYVMDPRTDTMSRNVLYVEELKGKVELSRVRDQFLFSIESAGQMDPEVLFPSAVRLMRSKIGIVRDALLALLSPPDDDEDQAQAQAAVEEGGMEVDS